MNKSLIAKRVLFVFLGALTVGITVWFYFVQKRNGYIDALTSSMFVSERNFESFPTGMLSAWSKAAADIENGMSVPLSSFSFNGVNYNIRTGVKL